MPRLKFVTDVARAPAAAPDRLAHLNVPENFLVDDERTSRDEATLS